MKRVFYVLCVLSGLCVSPLKAEPKFTSDLDKALAKAAKENKHVFLDYYAAWCPPCQKLEKDVIRAGALGPWEKDFVFVHLDGDNLPKSASYKKYPLTGYPTVWVIDPSGRALGRHVGFESKDEFLGFLSDALAGGEWKAKIDSKLAKSPNDPEAVADAFSAALGSGEKDKAEALKKKIKDRREEWDATYERALLDEASTAMYGVEPDYSKVLVLADAFLAEFPKGYFAPGLLHMKAKALRASGQLADGDTLAASLTQEYPESASAYWRLLEYARVNAALKAEAGAALEAGLAKFSDDERFLNQAVLFLRDGDPKRAAGIVQTLKKIKPENTYYDDLLKTLGKGGKRDG